MFQVPDDDFFLHDVVPDTSSSVRQPFFLSFFASRGNLLLSYLNVTVLLYVNKIMTIIIIIIYYFNENVIITFSFEIACG